MTKRALPPHVYRKPKGVYFQRRGWSTVRMQHEPGSPEFAMEYAAILNGALTLPPDTRRTFAALVKSYIASPRYRKLAPRTARDYEKVLDWVKDTLGHLPVAGIQRKDIIRARDANAQTVRFANYIVQVVRILLEHSIDVGWRSDNPAKGVSLLKADTAPRQPWPPAMIEAFRQKAVGRGLLVFELCLGTGQRIGDVLNMKWSDIEDDGISVRQSKTGADLWVPFTTHLAQALAMTPRQGETICAGASGQPISYRHASTLIMEVRRAIGAEAYDIHGLRYAAASELAEAGCSDDLIAAVTGHATSAMVRKYSRVARQRSRAIEAQSMRK
ncbi:tyrosine-type recombinase/integrase [Falsirhodobacter halotolerans]|uniref:tyrosine-type recombinase/integrase n=1 Tax=Falsirhodobacter halotolerans TaxID=1146892 RepID=UPI001FD1E910|nr:tyrosine-type recombinase/integrase [Falsirhodobacter halotolerans]MCJ8139600.1 tyrosine-type recombinase/integrase [Falsirhodobacter halotolerans]